MLLGLRSVIYPAPDLAAARGWFTEVLGHPPYVDEPFYVGFDVGGFELGLDPDAEPAVGPQTYWGVADLEVAVERLLQVGATRKGPTSEVGDGIKMALLVDPSGFPLGLIENPHFGAREVPTADGPGR